MNISETIEDSHTSTANIPRKEKYEFLRNLPDNDNLYHCASCKYVFNIKQEGMTNLLTILRGNWVAFCPNCRQNNAELLCKVSAYSIYLKLQGHTCNSGELVSGAESCPICDKSICPKCFNHNVVALSRVTGYMSAIIGWNNGKRQELIDRQRYNIQSSQSN
jgi:rubrerythrin